MRGELLFIVADALDEELQVDRIAHRRLCRVVGMQVIAGEVWQHARGMRRVASDRVEIDDAAW